MKRAVTILASLVAAAVLAGCGGGGKIKVPEGDYDKSGSAVNPVRPEGYVPPMDPKRKVSEQDCSEAVDTAGGNLKCKPYDAAAARRRQEELERQRLAARRAKLEEEERLRREALARAEQERLERERLERERLERERAEQLAREEAERQRLAALRAKQEEEERLRREAAARAEQERLERERLEREAAERERQRLEQEWLAGRALLEKFMASYGKVDKFREVAEPIGGFLDKTR